MSTVSADPVRLLLLAGGVHQQRLRLSGSRARLSPAVARAAAGGGLPVPLPVVEPLLADLERALTTTMARAERVAHRLLAVDGSLRIPLPRGGHAEMPLSLAVLARGGPAALLADDDPDALLEALGAFAVGSGRWARRHRDVVAVLLGARGRSADAAGIRDALRAVAGSPAKGTVVERVLGTRAGLAIQLAGLGADLRTVQQQGNPLRALARHGNDYMADLNRVTFDGTAIAFTRSPGPLTGAAVAASGAAWLDWELADDRVRTLGLFAGAALQVQDAARNGAARSADLVTDGAVTVAGAAEARLGLVPKGTTTAVALAATAVDGATARADRVLDDATHRVRRRAGRAVDGAARAVTGALEAGADALDEGLRRLVP